MSVAVPEPPEPDWLGGLLPEGKPVTPDDAQRALVEAWRRRHEAATTPQPVLREPELEEAPEPERRHGWRGWDAAPYLVLLAAADVLLAYDGGRWPIVVPCVAVIIFCATVLDRTGVRRR